MFLNDYLIIMDWNPTPQNLTLQGYALSLDDLKKIKALEINTMMAQVYWNNVEPNMGEIQWAFIDALVKRYRAAGLRTMLVTPILVPFDAPDDYYLKYDDGTLDKTTFSIWNTKAMECEHKFLEKMVERYAAPDVHIVLGELAGGEFLLPLRAAYYDASAVTSYGRRPDANMAEWFRKSVVDHYLYIQEPLVKQHGEIWDAMHKAIVYWSGNTGNQFQTDIHAAYHTKWPDATVVLLQYTFMEHIQKEGYLSHIENLKRMGAKIIIEANYSSGLRESTPFAVSHGYSGQLCGLLHPYAPGGARDHVGQEQIEALTQSLGLWNGSH